MWRIDNMSKVGEYYRELEELNGSTEEPSDEELDEIEAEADNMNMLKDFEQEVLDFPEIYNVFQ
jgi:hypothetical protein